MAVINFREILPRTFQHRFGESPTATRVFNVTVTQPTSTQEILNSVGILHGSFHPEYQYLLCTDGSVTETDAYHAEITYTYEVPQSGTDEFDPNPLSRPDVWSFSTGGADVPCLYYYAGNAIAPLVNSAGDFIEGVTCPEAEIRATISGNRARFDYSLAANVTNCLNNQQYLGGAPYTWLCAGISGQQQLEVVNDAQIKYWSFSAELIYRAGTHLLFLPDVGLQYLSADKDSDSAPGGEGASSGDETPYIAGGVGTQNGVQLIHGKNARQAGGVRKRAWCYSPEDGEKQESPGPVALNPDGTMKPAGAPPNILVRRVHRTINFAQFFGVPTF
jgi:hypothetical protein